MDYDDYIQGDAIRKKAESEFIGVKNKAEEAYNDFTSGMLDTIKSTKKLKNAAATVK